LRVNFNNEAVNVILKPFSLIKLKECYWIAML